MDPDVDHKTGTLHVICGPMASGKTTLLNSMVADGIERVVTFTTRPKRPGEIENVDYCFVNESQFFSMDQMELMICVKRYKTAEGYWYYGVPKHALDVSNGDKALVLDPEGVLAIKLMALTRGTNIRVTYVHANYTERLRRLEKRGDDPNEVERRVASEGVLFEAFTKACPPDATFFSPDSN